MVPKALACALAVALFGISACAQTFLKKEEAPAFFTQVNGEGVLYGHNWEDRPCFTIQLDSTAWKLEESTVDRVVWTRGEQAFALYLTDNRKARFAVGGMKDDGALLAFMGFELDFVKPRFDFQVTYPPRLAEDDNGVWMQWGWEGHGGKQVTTSVDKPADQRHSIASLWVDPWVLSLDWATTDLSVPAGVTPAMIDVLESVTFYPECFAAMQPGETRGGAPPRFGGR